MLTYDEAHRLFIYDPETGVLTRRISTSHNAQAGMTVGTLDGKGYLHVSVKKKFYRVHRVCFLMAHGYLPDEVDHVDRDRTNNRQSNLRAAGRRQNAGNTRAPITNTSGFKGVSFSSHTGKWHAQIKVSGKQTYLGGYASPEDAARRYDMAARDHFGDFALVNFT